MAYMKGQVPEPMTKDELEELYRNWNPESWKVLAERNIRLAIRIANSFSNTGIEEEELLSIAFLGLVKSAKKFEPSFGYKFATFSSVLIKNEILMELKKRRIHPYPKESIDEVSVNENGDSLCIREWLADRIDIENVILYEELLSILLTTIQTESERNQEIIRMFFLQNSQKEIGSRFGISQSYVSKIIKRFKKNFEEAYRRWK